jgi:hypothetical protein
MTCRDSAWDGCGRQEVGKWRRKPASKGRKTPQDLTDRQVGVPRSWRPEGDQAIHSVAQEIETLSKSMREDLQAADKGIAAAGALIVAGLGVALLQKATIVLVALPYGLGIVFFYTLQKYAERLSSAGIRSYLEDTLQRALNGKSPFIQQQVADYWHKKRRDETVASALYGLVIIASVGASLYVANRQAKLSSAVPFAHWMSTKHHLLTFAPKFSGLAYADAIVLGILLVALYFPYETMSQAKDIARRKAEAQGLDSYEEHPSVGPARIRELLAHD